MNSKELAKIFKALSNENRLEIYMEILRCTEKSYDDDNCCECFTEKKGKFVIAKINKDLVDEACDMLKLDSNK